MVSPQEPRQKETLQTTETAPSKHCKVHEKFNFSFQPFSPSALAIILP